MRNTFQGRKQGLGFQLHRQKSRREEATAVTKADTSHDCKGGGGEGQNFPTIKPTLTTATTTVVGTYVRFRHYITDLTPQ